MRTSISASCTRFCNGRALPVRRGKGCGAVAGLDSGGAFCHMASSAAALCVSDLSSPHELPGRSPPSSGDVTQLMLAAGDLVDCLAASANGGPTGVPACIACVASPAVQLQGLAAGASCADPRSTLSTLGSSRQCAKASVSKQT